MLDSLSAISPHSSEKEQFDIDLTTLPPVYVLESRLSHADRDEVENVLLQYGAPLTFDVKEARVLLGNVTRAKRAKLELRWKGINVIGDECLTKTTRQDDAPAPKRQRLEFNKTASPRQAPPSTMPLSPAKANGYATKMHEPVSHGRMSPNLVDLHDTILIVQLEWLHECQRQKKPIPLEPYIVFRAQHDESDDAKYLPKPTEMTHVSSATTINDDEAANIIARAKSDQPSQKQIYNKKDRIKAAAAKDIIGRTFSTGIRPTHLLHQSTSEHDEDSDVSLPVMPDWVKDDSLYSCERVTPVDSPNSDFIAKLKLIRLARLLTMDEIGVRAYSTSIASIAAYPYLLRSRREVLALPGCEQKIAHLFYEYKMNEGEIQAVTDIENDPALSVLRQFYEIWGVGAVTARDFYYEKGWRDLDDVVEFGWGSLSRVQQIGLKYYDEFLLKIPRAEVESIAATITEHTQRLVGPNVEAIIVGGYRRGKSESGDVDVILSHPDNDMTYALVTEVVKSLEEEGWITHCLTLNLTNTKRDQQPLKLDTLTAHGRGFDTLDKALVVWQDPHWPSMQEDLAANPHAKNPNVHRRVDIIISPWRTVGCAVAGWTSGTTFQRDLRRYVKKVKGWKFDSSGVRSRETGQWIDLEGWSDQKTRCRSWQEAERRVFEGIGLVYREPWDRCTG